MKVKHVRSFLEQFDGEKEMIVYLPIDDGHIEFVKEAIGLRIESNNPAIVIHMVPPDEFCDCPHCMAERN